MATKIILFNPLTDQGRADAEAELDVLLTEGYSVISSTGAHKATLSTERIQAPWGFDSYSDYMVVILHKHEATSAE